MVTEEEVRGGWQGERYVDHGACLVSVKKGIKPSQCLSETGIRASQVSFKTGIETEVKKVQAEQRKERCRASHGRRFRGGQRAGKDDRMRR
jgi:hypothetical protein